MNKLWSILALLVVVSFNPGTDSTARRRADSTARRRAHHCAGRQHTFRGHRGNWS